MEAYAIAKRVRLSARKARLITRLIQGQRVAQALATLQGCPQKAAPIVTKVLKSAVANARARAAAEDELVVREAVASEGPRLKRIRPAPRGRALPVIKRYSHIKITVSDGR